MSRRPSGIAQRGNTWWWGRLVLADLRRHVAATILAVGLLALGVLLLWISVGVTERLAAAGALVIFVAGLSVWRRCAHRSFHWWVGRWWGAWWRRRFLYEPTWVTLATRHGLFVTDRISRPAGDEARRGDAVRVSPRHHVTVELAALSKVRFSPGVDHLLVSLPAGITPDTVAAACDSLTHAWRALSVRVRADAPGSVWLDVTRADTLNRPVSFAGVPRCESTDAAVAALDGTAVGVLADGSPWYLRLRGSHVLIAGTTGSGKSSLLWALVASLADGIRHGFVTVTWLDPKGGMEALPARPLAEVVDRVDDMPTALEQLVAELDRRAADLAGTSRQHTPATSSPHRLVIIDELATLTALADAKVARRVEAALGALLSRGRAVGFTVVTTTVDPSKDVVRWRGLHAVRVAFRLDEPIQVDMVLGDGARNRGAACDRIPLSTPGVCFVRVDGQPEPLRARAAHVTDEQIAELGVTYAARARPADVTDSDVDVKEQAVPT